MHNPLAFHAAVTLVELSNLNPPIGVGSVVPWKRWDNEIMADPRRDTLKDRLRQEFERTLNERIDRYLSVNHQQIIGQHHFAHASAECINTYRDGYFLSCVTVTQAVSEGILKFVAERNGITPQKEECRQALARRLQSAGIVSEAFVSAFERIWRSFRNDFHHMNPPVASAPLEALAKRNMSDLACIEREVFGFSVRDGLLIPDNPCYWDVQDDGTVPVYARLS